MTASQAPDKRSKGVQRVTTAGRPRTTPDAPRSTEDQKGAAGNDYAGSRVSDCRNPQAGTGSVRAGQKGPAAGAARSTGGGSYHPEAGTGGARSGQEGPADGAADYTDGRNCRPSAGQGDLLAGQGGDPATASAAGVAGQMGNRLGVEEG